MREGVISPPALCGLSDVTFRNLLFWRIPLRFPGDEVELSEEIYYFDVSVSSRTIYL